MNLNTLKEELINAYRNFNDIVVNSSVFYFIKEKYDHLSSLHRKILHSVLVLTLAFVFLYYPFSYLYYSWRNMRDFHTKKQLTKELVDSSFAEQMSSSQSYTPDRDPVQFINQRIPILQIPKNQIKNIKKSETVQKPKNLLLPATVKTIEVEMENLNLKEVIQYGHQLEQLSNNIKLMNLHITERPQKDNYFNVSYILSFFNAAKETIPNNKKTQKKINPANTKNDEIFDELKIKKSPPSLPKLSTEKQLKKKEKDSEVPLLNLKKEDIVNGSIHFENRPEKVKRRDLLPRTFLPKNKKDAPSTVDPPPLPPSIDNSFQPDSENTEKKKEQ